MEWLSVEKIAAYIAVATAIVTMLWNAFKWGRDRERQREEFFARTRIMWDAFVQRGYLEARRNNMVDTEALVAPGRNKYRLPPTPEIRNIFERDGMAARLHNLWYKFKHLPESDLSLMIEHEYRDWLIANICEVYRVDNGACVAMALEVALEPKYVGKPPSDSRPRVAS